MKKLLVGRCLCSCSVLGADQQRKCASSTGQNSQDKNHVHKTYDDC